MNNVHVVGLLCLLTLCACHRDPQNPEPVLRQNFSESFQAGTRFAIAKQSYPSHRHQRIVTHERVLIEKQIKHFLENHDFVYDPQAQLVISFYREFYDPSKEGPLDVKVKMLRETGFQYYNLRLEDLDAQYEAYNDRDGALVFDIVDTETGRLIRQVAIPYYFGSLQKALRESRDREDVDYLPSLNLLVPGLTGR